jgi:hypothetical protein
MPVAARIFWEVALPIPKMYVSPISTRLSRGKSTPDIRAMLETQPPFYPCFCLCFGFSQITMTLPLRLMTLHFSQIGFTDGLTFMVNPPKSFA